MNTNTQEDSKILRGLARQYLEAARADRNQERAKLHTAVNDLRMIRPVVQIDELPWNEMALGDELTLRCADPFLRGIEDFLRKTLYKFRNLPADMIVKPYIPVRKVISHSDIGVQVLEEQLATDAANEIVSHAYEDQFAQDSSLSMLKDVTVSYDKVESLRRFELLGAIVGDIIPIKLTGVGMIAFMPWDDISRYRGVSALLMDLIERPEFSHALVERLTVIMENIMRQYEEMALLESDPDLLHCTPTLTNDLPRQVARDGAQLTRKDMWGRGTAQIFASVGRDMLEEFEIPYMQRIIGSCGLSYYGCCEPLDKRIDIVAKIKNLRKISMTPWADVDIGAEAIGSRYVLSSKPTPSSVAAPMLDKDDLKKEMRRILEACKRNNCAVDITLKDISTCCFRPQNIFEWEQIVMDMVTNY